MSFLQSGLFFFIVFVCFSAEGQHSFIRKLNIPSSSGTSVLTDTSGDFFLAASDSTLYRFTACGAIRWGKTFSSDSFSIVSTNTGPVRSQSLIRTKDGGIAKISKVKTKSGLFCTLITRFDATGNVTMSALLKDGISYQEPGILTEDPEGNFYLLGKSSFTPGPVVYHHLTRISKQGQILWSKSYSLGASFLHGGIATSDSGFLFLTGNYVVKTTKTGDIAWAAFCSFEIAYDESFPDGISPMEEKDGYVLSLENGTLNWYTTFCISKNGQSVLWQKAGRNFNSVLKETPSGNRLSCFTLRDSFNLYPVLIELDSAYRIVRSNTIRLGQTQGGLTVTDFQIREDGSVLIAGRFYRIGFPSSARTFIAVAAPNFHMGCGDTPLPEFNTVPTKAVILTPQVIPVQNHVYQSFLLNLQVRTVSISDTILCGFEPAARLDLGKDTAICFPSDFSVRNKSSSVFDSFQWSTGEQTPQIQIQKPGTYWLKTIDFCILDTLTDTLVVSEKTLPWEKLQIDSVLCEQPSIRLSTHRQWDRYLWQDGSTDSVFIATEGGKYVVEVTQDNCKTRYDGEILTCGILVMPTLFSPNGDGKNDVFSPTQIRGIESASVRVYNRWGRLIFSSEDFIREGWDGHNGQDGIYFWHVQFKTSEGKNQSVQGTVTRVE